VEALEIMQRNAMPLPVIAVVDLNMPVMDGYATIAWLREHAPKVLPLALTFDAADDALVKSVRAGARGFLLKNTRPAVLKTALDSLMLTGYYYTDQTHQAMQDHPTLRTRQEREREAILDQITPREMEFLLLVCDPQEFTYEQMADRMGIHRRSVDNHRINLFEKFGIKSKTGLVLFALRWGIVQPG
jgi:DNA-binding NarL/FixJ family response regulator